MAVFISATDERSGKTHRDDFFFGGFLAPEKDWCDYFAPAWEERVLNGPPPIPYLHMTDIRSERWRSQHGLSRDDAENRTDEAISVISTMGSLVALTVQADAGHLRDQFVEMRVKGPGTRRNRPMEPDYICFLGYALIALHYVHEFQPDVERLDFMVELNGPITEYIRGFHDHLAEGMKFIGHPHLAPLVGRVIPAGKDRVPLQAADVLCWHKGRSMHPETMDASDVRRYWKLARLEGLHSPISKEDVSKIAGALSNRENPDHMSSRF